MICVGSRRQRFPAQFPLELQGADAIPAEAVLSIRSRLILPGQKEPLHSSLQALIPALSPHSADGEDSLESVAVRPPSNESLVRNYRARAAVRVSREQEEVPTPLLVLFRSYDQRARHHIVHGLAALREEQKQIANAKNHPGKDRGRASPPALSD